MWVEAVEHTCSEHRRGNVESGKDKTEMNWETGEEKEDRGGGAIRKRISAPTKHTPAASSHLLPYENTAQRSCLQASELHRNLLAF